MNLSNKCFWDDNLEKIKALLLKNNYPIRIIKKMLFIPSDSKPTTTAVKISDEIPIPPIFTKIPYVKGLSEKIARVLRSDEINIAMKCQNTLKRLYSNTKAKTPHYLETNVIYKIPCKDCDKFYIGQTGRYLNTRLKEHERDTKKNKRKQS